MTTHTWYSYKVTFKKDNNTTPEVMSPVSYRFNYFKYLEYFIVNKDFYKGTLSYNIRNPIPTPNV